MKASLLNLIDDISTLKIQEDVPVPNVCPGRE